MLDLLLMLLLATAHAGEVEDAALEASEVNAEACADATSSEATRTADALVVVSDAYRRVAQAYDAADPKPAFLLYWRGVLGLCLGRDELATTDLEAFVDLSADDVGYAPLVKDARNRLRRIEAQARLAQGPQRFGNPLVAIGLTGGFGRVGDASGHSYGRINVHGSVRLVGVLSLSADLRLGISQANHWADGEAATDEDGRQSHSVLGTVAVGPLLRFTGPVLPEVGLAFQLAPDPIGTTNLPVLLGATLHGGLSIPIGTSPLAIAIGGDVGFLTEDPTLGIGIGVAVQLGRTEF